MEGTLGAPVSRILCRAAAPSAPPPSDGHLSVPPTRSHRLGRDRCCLALLAPGVAVPPLSPGARWALTPRPRLVRVRSAPPEVSLARPPFHPYLCRPTAGRPSAVCFLLPCPSPFGASNFQSGVPEPVRTFLGSARTFPKKGGNPRSSGAPVRVSILRGGVLQAAPAFSRSSWPDPRTPCGAVPPCPPGRGRRPARLPRTRCPGRTSPR